MPPVLMADPQTDADPAPERAAKPLLGPDAQALVLFNPKAGGVNEGDQEKLIAALKAAGIERYALVGAEMMSKELFKRAKNFDVIVVLGGDGTARAVAQRAPLDGPPLILLPGGTLNMLPHALYGQLAWPEALAAALSRGKVKRLMGGRANDKRFYIAAIFGAPTLLARVREAVREGRPVTAWRRMRHFMQRAFAHRLLARPDGGAGQRTEAIGVLCPSFSGQLEGECLEWVRLDSKHLLDLARVSLRALGEGWRKDSTVEIAKCVGGEVRSAGVIPAVLDGEPKVFLSRVRIRYETNGPRVIALDPEG